MFVPVLKRLVFSAKSWAVAAVAAIGASFLASYIDAQSNADRALALRQGPPPAALIQDFDARIHQGPARELRLRAEAPLSNPVTVALGPDGRGPTAVIVALFPVSDAGRRGLSARLSGSGGLEDMRPVPRPVQDRRPPEALGILLHEAGAAAEVDVTTLVGNRFGAGPNGSVVEVNGERIAAGEMALVIQGAMAARDIRLADDFLVIAPYAQGRTAALSAERSSGVQKVLMWSGVTLGLGALLVAVGGAGDPGRRIPAARPAASRDVRMSPGSTAKARSRFKPLPTQEEIYAASLAEDQEAPAARSRSAWFGTMRWRRRPVRTRR